MFQVIGAMAEFERALIQERVRAGLKNAVVHGKRLGRPRSVVDTTEVIALRASGRRGARSRSRWVSEWAPPAAPSSALPRTPQNRPLQAPDTKRAEPRRRE
jgi:Resolvase, N terminal domain